MQQGTVVLLLIAIVVLLVVVVVLITRRNARTGDDSQAQIESSRELTRKAVDKLQPGDGIAFWGGDNVKVASVVECTERVNERTSAWRWVILSNNQLIWVAPDGKYIYDEPQTIYQGTPEFEQLTGEPGVLRTFEQRVRENASGSQPVHFEFGGLNFTVRSTGTFGAKVRGEPLTVQVWADISSDADQNVYFELDAATGEKALGVWTSHIAWYTGRILQDSDIDDIFHR